MIDGSIYEFIALFKPTVVRGRRLHHSSCRCTIRAHISAEEQLTSADVTLSTPHYSKSGHIKVQER